MTVEIAHGEANRLLKHLAGPGCYGLVSPLGCGRIALFRTVNGTSLGAGYVTPETVQALEAEGIVSWSRDAKPARLGLALPGRDASVAERAQCGGGALPAPAMDDRESPLLWLYRRAGKDGRPQISDEEFAAGERFRADITLAGMLPRVTMNWDAALTPEQAAAGPRDVAGSSDTALAARQRIRLACDRLGPELSGLAIDICGFLKGLDLVEKERRWPPRSAKVVLRVALAALVTHYGLDRRARQHGIISWQASDGRPNQFPTPG
ncbi:MAG: ATPase [Hyphomicrobiales bacterium]|nr:MAG: ATPase [Hyphomicrobiales bacterium]